MSAAVPAIRAAAVHPRRSTRLASESSFPHSPRREGHFGPHSMGNDFAKKQLRIRAKSQLQALAQRAQAGSETTPRHLQSNAGVGDAGKAARRLLTHQNRNAAA